MTATILSMARRCPMRRVRAVTRSGQPRRVHLELCDAQRGWQLACTTSAASLVVVDDDDPGPVDCRRCANSGMTPARWLTAGPLGMEASR